MKKGHTDIQWFELPNHFVFHYANSWEEGNIIKIFAVVHQDIKIGFNNKEHPFLAEPISKIPFYKFELDLDTGKHTYTKLIDKFSFEFPTINLDYMGYKNQFCYLPYFADKVGEGMGGSQNVFIKGFLKYDLQNEKILNQIDFGPSHTGQEVVFQKREGATSEDDGYLMTAIHDWKTDKSQLVMWDSKNLT